MKTFATFVFGIGVLFAAYTNVAAVLYGIDNRSGNLFRVSTTNASLTFVGNTGLQSIGDGPGALEFSPDGRLFAFTVGASPALYQINPNTAATSLIGPLGIGFVYEGGLAFSPGGGAYGVNQQNLVNSSLFTINLSTGQGTIVGMISGPVHDINGLGWRSDGMLLGLDHNTASLLTINPTTASSTVLSPLSPLNPALIGSVGGMALDGDSGYFCTSADGGTSSLYSFNALTGNYSLVGSFPILLTPGMSGLALAPVPEPSTLALTCIGLLIFLRFARRATHAATASLFTIQS